ncbi:hypothetical protein PY650_35995 [Rhizobium calliandrae]|uniref:Secreted protein n=1 Tax=Rhizobium calliandrae TaxID=1312182 RepID=A0ABT7KQC7_9HYPH|nr:hypothetical protein [Rhizobium calliandrae]MDL2410841.1 hypothetical protein [Rhizobium calliandrae]
MREALGAIVVGLSFVAVASAPAMAGQNCYCKSKDGTLHPIGAVACMTVDGKSYLARCQMNLNVTSWSKLQEGCPVTEISPWQQSAWHLQPIAVR